MLKITCPNAKEVITFTDSIGQKMTATHEGSYTIELPGIPALITAFLGQFIKAEYLNRKLNREMIDAAKHHKEEVQPLVKKVG